MGKNTRYVILLGAVIGLIWLTFNVRVERRTAYEHFRGAGGEQAILDALEYVGGKAYNLATRLIRWTRRVAWAVVSTLGTWFDNTKRAIRAGWRAWQDPDGYQVSDYYERPYKPSHRDRRRPRDDPGRAPRRSYDAPRPYDHPDQARRRRTPPQRPYREDRYREDRYPYREDRYRYREDRYGEAPHSRRPRRYAPEPWERYECDGPDCVDTQNFREPPHADLQHQRRRIEALEQAERDLYRRRYRPRRRTSVDHRIRPQDRRALNSRLHPRRDYDDDRYIESYPP